MHFLRAQRENSIEDLRTFRLSPSKLSPPPASAVGESFMPHPGFPLYDSICLSGPERAQTDNAQWPGHREAGTTWASIAIVIAAVFVALILHASSYVQAKADVEHRSPPNADAARIAVGEE
jgi:hypothetical protein